MIKEPEATEGARQREQIKLDRAIAEGFYKSIQSTLTNLLHNRGKLAQRVFAKRNSIVMCLEIPFQFPPFASEDPWLGNERHRQQTLKGFADHLANQDLSVHILEDLPAQLTNYLLKSPRRARYSTELERQLRRIPQRVMAGRKGYKPDDDSNAEISKTLTAVRDWVQRLKKIVDRRVASNYTDEAIASYLRTRFKYKDKIRFQAFERLIPRLPRRRYMNASANALEGDKPGPATISEPREWDVRRISAVIAQDEILEATSKKPPLNILLALMR